MTTPATAIPDTERCERCNGLNSECERGQVSRDRKPTKRDWSKAIMVQCGCACHPWNKNRSAERAREIRRQMGVREEGA